MLKRFIQTSLFFLFTTSFSLQGNAAVDYVVQQQPQIIEKSTNFVAQGILKQKANGYLYLEVSNQFIADLLPLIEAKGVIVPPHHFTSKKGIGAHISVMYENEQIVQEIWEVKELGQTFNFKVKELRTVLLKRDSKIRKLWLLAVECLDLERLRESYGLSPLLKNHDFHITIGTQIPGKPHQQREEQEGEAA